MGDEKGHRGSGITSLNALNVKDANRRRSYKEADAAPKETGKKAEHATGKKLGKANTLVMRSLDQLARKYTGNGDENTSQQLQEVLDSHVGFLLFSAHLHAEYSSENIQFWEAATDFPHHPTLKECHRIVQMYIVEGSEFQINISQAVRQQVLEETEQLGTTEPGDDVWKSKKDLFELAKTEIFNLMHRDSFPRFRRSQLYRVYKKKQAIDQAAETRFEAKRRHENPCKYPHCGREAKLSGYCDEHKKGVPTQKSLAMLAEIEASYTVQKDKPHATLQEVLDHQLGSCFFGHYCAIEVKEAGEVRLQGGTSKATINPQYYYNCYKLIAEFKQAPSFNTASLCVANHLEVGAPCPVEIPTALRTQILGVIEPLRKVARDNLASETAAAASQPAHAKGDSGGGSSGSLATHRRSDNRAGLDVDVFSFVAPPSAEMFDEVSQVVVTGLGDVFTRFLSSPWWEPCRAQMESWDALGGHVE